MSIGIKAWKIGNGNNLTADKCEAEIAICNGLIPCKEGRFLTLEEIKELVLSVPEGIAYKEPEDLKEFLEKIMGEASA